jgi:hypothetical protein
MFDRKLLFSISTVLLLTCYDLSRSYTSQKSSKTNPSSTTNYFLKNDHNDISSIPTPKMKMHMGTIIKFRYCFSCGYVYINNFIS